MTESGYYGGTIVKFARGVCRAADSILIPQPMTRSIDIITPEQIMKKYPGKVPVKIVYESQILRFIVSENLTMGELIHLAKGDMRIYRTDAVFASVVDRSGRLVLISPQDYLTYVYNKYKSPSKVLAITLRKESVFG